MYRLWQTGFLNSGTAKPLGDEAWWVVVVAGTFTAGMWFGFNAPVLIVLGAGMGLIWFAVVR